MSDKPIYILPENVQRTIGKDAQRNNILAAKIIADTIKTTLGPKGMDKMLVNSLGEITITNDGVTILEEMELEHPAARIMVDIARTQENEVGDGTTTAVMLAGKLLENAEFLLDQKIHPTVIIKGYQIALRESEKILKELAVSVTPEQIDLLKNIAMTAMTGKGAENSKQKLAQIIVEALSQLYTNEVDIDDIKIERSKGEDVNETQLIRGIILNKQRASSEMPSEITDSKILLIDFGLEIKSLENQTRISINTPEQLQGFIDHEETTIKQMTEKITEVGANVVFCQRGIDDIAQYYLSKKGIYACRRVQRSDLEKISKATGAHIVSNINELNEKDLGFAQQVKEFKNSEDKMTLIEGCRNPKAVSILIRGSSDHLIAEIERAIRDGLGDVASVLKNNKVVSGAGAIEIELSKRLKKFSQNFSGRERLAIEKFAETLEFIPLTLAENAGLDPIDILTELRSKHDNNEIFSGINLLTGKIENSIESGIIEPLKIKTQALSSATEVATMILRIDDVLAAYPKDKKTSMNINPLQDSFD